MIEQLSAYIVSTFLDSYGNKSGKLQPIWTKVGTHAQLKGRQRWRNFGRDRLSGGEMGGSKVSQTPEFFCKQYEMTFRQLRKSRFSPNLAITRKSWLKRRFWTEIYEKFPFRGHLPQNPKLGGGQTGRPISLRTGYRSRDALQRNTVYSKL